MPSRWPPPEPLQSRGSQWPCSVSPFRLTLCVHSLHRRAICKISYARLSATDGRWPMSGTNVHATPSAGMSGHDRHARNSSTNQLADARKSLRSRSGRHVARRRCPPWTTKWMDRGGLSKLSSTVPSSSDFLISDSFPPRSCLCVWLWHVHQSHRCCSCRIVSEGSDALFSQCHDTELAVHPVARSGKLSLLLGIAELELHSYFLTSPA